jgi:hypothetical protein
MKFNRVSSGPVVPVLSHCVATPTSHYLTQSLSLANWTVSSCSSVTILP